MEYYLYTILHTFIPCILVISAIAFGVLKLLFKFYFKEYEMDLRSMIMLSLKTFGTFVTMYFIFLFWMDMPDWPNLILSALGSFSVARKLFILSGLNKKEVWRVTLSWFAVMLIIISYFLLPLARGILLLSNYYY